MWHQEALLARIGISFPNNVIKFVMFHTKNRYQDVMSLIGEKSWAQNLWFSINLSFGQNKKNLKTIFHKRTANICL